MRILVLLPSLTDSLGGIQTYSQALVWSLNDLASQHTSPHPPIRSLALHDGDAAGVEVASQLHHVRHSGYNGSKLGFGLAAIWAARHADLVLMTHIHFAPLLRIMRWVSPGVSCGISVHGIEVWKPLKSAIMSALKQTDQVWPVSEYTRRRMIKENPELEPILRFEVLPNTLGPAYPPAGQMKDRCQLGLPSGKILLCVSRLAPEESYKNVESLIGAMPVVLQQEPDAFLCIVGPGSDRPRLEAVAQKAGVQRRVHFAGKVAADVLQSYFATCDLFVLPSTGEGFGIVYLEAMYHAKACIGARAGGVPEVIADGETGLLVDPSVPSELPGAIIRLLRDDALRTSMGRAGKVRLDREFSLPRFRERLAGLLSNQRRAPRAAGS